MKYWKVNGELIKAGKLATALRKYGQKYDRFGIGKTLDVSITRINRKSFVGQGGRP